MEDQKNYSLPLLYEVRKDAFIKANRKEPYERFFGMIYLMHELNISARKGGLLELEEAVEKLPPETAFYQDVQSAASAVADGFDLEDLTELLTSWYWAKNLQGDDALLYFMMISSFIRIILDTPPYLLECLLLACLPDGAARQYAVYKKQFPQEAKPTPRERLLGRNPDFKGSGILVVKELLEKKIEQADSSVLKKVIKESNETDILLALKGLSIPAKKKLFSVLSEYRADKYAEDSEYMGPVREIDVMAAFAELAAAFEKQPKEEQGFRYL